MVYLRLAKVTPNSHSLRETDRRVSLRPGLLLLCLLFALFKAPGFALGQDMQPKPAMPQNTQSDQAKPSEPASDAPAADSSESDTLTLFPHSDSSRYWISGQANVIFQWHPTFHSPYSGKNSLKAAAENDTSKVYTLFLGYELSHTTEVFLDVESAGGHGIGAAFGLAGFTNLDVVRNPTLGEIPYLARVMIRQIIPLTSEREDADRDQFHLARSLPARRIEFRGGKFGMADFFDLNSFGSDSHLQFLNWTVDNNGAYDYAANTRGYTDGIILEYDDHWFTARFGEVLMPKVANGIHLDADIARARAENLELEFRGAPLAGQAGVVRVLSYLNHADMGNYREAIENYYADESSTPDIISTRRQGRHKFGFGLNFEQNLTPQISLFGRVGWSDGRNESFAYTEDDRTLELGAFTKGDRWHRRNDRAGVAFVANAIVAAHQEYLALGGIGFLLGDGALTYGPEKIFEGFYTAHVWRGFFASFDIQHINNPGYNQARGPVTVPGLRFHVDF
jgi:high affinity Mn2+ porin